MKKRKIKDKELYVVNFYGVLSFICMIVFALGAIINKKIGGSDLIYIAIGITFVVSVIFAIYSICSTLKVREYGVMLALITLIFMTGTIVSSYYGGTFIEVNKNNKSVDNALKCASAKKCEIIEDGNYVCELDDGNTVICPNQWHNYYRK